MPVAVETLALTGPSANHGHDRLARVPKRATPSGSASGDGRAPSRSRAAIADRRRAELLEAARQVVLQRGMASTRVADVASATNVSGGLIHYHFATKDDLMAEMLRASSLEEQQQLERIASDSGSAVARLDRIIRHYLPRAKDDQSWILWIEAWAASLRTPALRDILTGLEGAWISMLERVIREGVETGEFDCEDPAGAAERLDALLDGLLLRATVHPDAIPRRRLLEHARIAAAYEVGLERSAFPRS
jgi:AcrR family transcriptional regulator